jgi:hypothetical protein
MKSHAAKLAGWLLKQEAANDRKRLERLYLRVLNRPVMEGEGEEAERFLGANAAANGERRREAWADYCHALFSSNEFLYCL